MVQGFFYNSVDGDRKYNADSVNESKRPFYRDGVFDGNLAVTADGEEMAVVVDGGEKTGYAWINAHTIHNTTPLKLDVSQASGTLDRIDRVVLKNDEAERKPSIYILEGNFSSNPKASELTNTDIIQEKCLAEIYVHAGAVAITQEDITDTREDETVCGFVVSQISSSSGSEIQPIYFADGKPKACAYTIEKSVPANAVFTDTNTWRGIQNNLTSDSTTDSLSAAQGKVLKGLVDGKLPLTGGIVNGGIQCKTLTVSEITSIKELNVKTNAYIIGSIDSAKIIAQNGISFGTPGAQYSCGITTKWLDNSEHYAMERSSDGLSLKLGWVGNTTYKTVCLLRAQTVKYANASGTTTLSDERMKNSFKSLDEYDNVFMDLKPCAFRYNNGSSGRYHFGFKAQDIKAALEKNGFTTKDFAGFVQMHISDHDEVEECDGIADPMGLIYTEFVPWTIYKSQKNSLRIDFVENMQKQMQQQICKLQNEASAIKKENQELKEQIQIMKEQIDLILQNQSGKEDGE